MADPTAPFLHSDQSDRERPDRFMRPYHAAQDVDVNIDAGLVE